jgi:hypothetical protein
MKLRHPRIAVAVAVGVVGLFTFGAVSSAGAATFPMKAFLQTGQATNVFNVTGARVRVQCTSDSHPTLPANFIIARIIGTASNGIAKSDGVDELDTAYNNDNDDLDTNDTLDLLQDSFSGDWQRHEVGGQADYMGSGGNPVVNMNYSTEQAGSQGQETVGADCALWGAFQAFS